MSLSIVIFLLIFFLGSYILMFRMHQSYEDLRMDITYEDQHVGDSPYVFKGRLLVLLKHLPFN